MFLKPRFDYRSWLANMKSWFVLIPPSNPQRALFLDTCPQHRNLYFVLRFILLASGNTLYKKRNDHILQLKCHRFLFDSRNYIEILAILLSIENYNCCFENGANIFFYRFIMFLVFISTSQWASVAYKSRS